MDTASSRSPTGPSRGTASRLHARVGEPQEEQLAGLGVGRGGGRDAHPKVREVGGVGRGEPAEHVAEHDAVEPGEGGGALEGDVAGVDPGRVGLRDAHGGEPGQRAGADHGPGDVLDEAALGLAGAGGDLAGAEDGGTVALGLLVDLGCHQGERAQQVVVAQQGGQDRTFTVGGLGVAVDDGVAQPLPGVPRGQPLGDGGRGGGFLGARPLWMERRSAMRSRRSASSAAAPMRWYSSSEHASAACLNTSSAAASSARVRRCAGSARRVRRSGLTRRNQRDSGVVGPVIA